MDLYISRQKHSHLKLMNPLIIRYFFSDLKFDLECVECGYLGTKALVGKQLSEFKSSVKFTHIGSNQSRKAVAEHVVAPKTKNCCLVVILVQKLFCVRVHLYTLGFTMLVLHMASTHS